MFFWLLDRVVHCCFPIVINTARDDWLKYSNSDDGRRKFQIDLALAVMECGIKYDWPAPYDDKVRPKWLRQKSYIPCACGLCFFCNNGKTTGVQSKPAVGTPVTKRGKLCSTIRQNLGRQSGTYCRECLRKRRLTHPNEKNVVAKK